MRKILPLLFAALFLGETSLAQSIPPQTGSAQAGAPEAAQSPGIVLMRPPSRNLLPVNPAAPGLPPPAFPIPEAPINQRPSLPLVNDGLVDEAPTDAQGEKNQTGALPDGEIKETGTEINVKNADISAIIRIFSKKAKRNYILDENVKGKVSIYLPGKVSPEESIRILDSVLALKGFTSVPIGENLWKIIPSKDAKQSTIPTVTDETAGPGSAAIVTRLVNLKYVGADDVKTLLTPLISGDGLINAYAGTNSLIIIDSDDNIRRVADIIKNLDVPSSDREMTIIPIKHAEAGDIAKKITEILEPPKGDSSRSDSSGATDLVRARLRDSLAGGTNTINTGQPLSTGLRTAGGGTAAGATVGARAREPKIIPDDRTNSLIVVADEDMTARIRALVDQLDSEVDLSGYRFYVYHCQYASADELAQVLAGMSGGSTGSTTRAGASDGRLTDGIFGGGGGASSFGSSRGSGSSSSSMNGRQLSNSRTQSRLSSQNRTLGQGRSSTSTSGGAAANFGDNISITADPSTNSLIISASKSDYLKIKQLLEELDVKRRQVLVEAMLLEVGINDSQRLGTSFITSAGGKDGGILAKNDLSGNLANLLSDPTKISDFSVAAASAGTLTLPGGLTIPTQSILLNAAKNNSNVNVLSAPTILATDNESAEIVVGQNVPFLASKATSDQNLNNTFNQIDRQDVGITLRLTPKISSSDAVSMQIFTEVSNVVESTATSDLGPTTSLRTSETSVVTKDGQMIVIGGLMSDSVSDATDGVPFLKDVPVLGHLFRSTSETKRRTNLLIFITPRIVKDQFDARDNTLERRDKLEKDFDNYEIYPYRDDVLHNPDMNKVTGSSRLELEKPGTIIPKSESPADSEIGSDKTSLEGSQSLPEKAIEIEVEPKLPESKSEAPAKAAAPAKKSAPLAKTKPGKQSPEGAPAAPSSTSPAAVKGDAYISMQLVNGSSAELPFKTLGKDGAIGIVLPADSSAEAKGFFRQGGVYEYQVDNKKYAFRIVGMHDASAAAKAQGGSLGDWYTLSPYEIMNLGGGPWFAAR